MRLVRNCSWNETISAAVLRMSPSPSGTCVESQLAGMCSLPCVQGRVRVGLHELAAQHGLIAGLPDPTPALPYFAGEGAFNRTAAVLRMSPSPSGTCVESQLAGMCPLPCVQERVRVGLHELAAQHGLIARLLDPTQPSPTSQGRERSIAQLRSDANRVPEGEELTQKVICESPHQAMRSKYRTLTQACTRRSSTALAIASVKPRRSYGLDKRVAPSLKSS